MRGLVTTRHLLTHAPIIVKEFGWRAYFRCWMRCLFAPRTVTFLSCVCSAAQPAREPSADPKRLHALPH